MTMMMTKEINKDNIFHKKVFMIKSFITLKCNKEIILKGLFISTFNKLLKHLIPRYALPTCKQKRSFPFG